MGIMEIHICRHVYLHVCSCICVYIYKTCEHAKHQVLILLFIYSFSETLRTVCDVLEEGLANCGPWAKSSYFYVACKLRMVFTFFYWLETNQKMSNNWWLVKIMWNSNFSIHKVLLDYNCIRLFTCSLAAFVLQQLSQVGATETICPAEPKIFTVWPFTKIFVDRYLRRYKKWVGWNLPESKHTSQYLTRYSPTLPFL